MDHDIERILFTQKKLSQRVSEIGKTISSDYKDKNPLIVGILKGSVVFMADILRALDIPCEIDFLSVRSYGSNAFSSGHPEIVKDLDTDISGRHVILVEDILDTAATLNAISKVFRKRAPASLSICTLLEKRVPHVADIKPDYKCFDVENEFVVGYGLDYAQRYRNLPYIGVLKPEIYK